LFFLRDVHSELAGRRLRRPKGDNAAIISLVPYHKNLLLNHLLFAKRDLSGYVRVHEDSYNVVSSRFVLHIATCTLHKDKLHTCSSFFTRLLS
jgi:hypothetical protein